MAVSKEVQALLDESKGYKTKTASAISPETQKLINESRQATGYNPAQGAVEGVITGIGIPQGALNLAKGEAPYSGSPTDIASQVSSDISGLASIPLGLGKTAARTAVNVGVGALTGGAMGAGDVGNKIKGFSDDVYNFIESNTFKLLPQEAKQSVFANLLTQIVPIIATTSIEALPSSLGLLNVKSTDLSPQGAMALEKNIPITKSAEPLAYPGDVTREKSIQQTYPNVYKPFEELKQQAIKKEFETVSPEIGMTAESLGGKTKGDILEKYNAIGEQFGKAEEQILQPKIGGEKIYHGTDKTFKNFDISKSADGSIWFTADKTDITNPKRGVAATGKGKIIERKLPSNIKLADIDMADKYLTDELINMGYDGVKYPAGENQGVWYQIFNPEKLISGSTPSFSGKNASKKIYKYLIDNKVTDVNDFKGNELITDPGLAKVIDKHATMTQNAKSVQDLVQQKRQYWTAAETYLEGKPSSLRTQARDVYNIYNESIMEALPEGKVKEDWKAANKEYSDISKQIDLIAGNGGIDDVKAIANEKIFSQYVTGKGTVGAEALKELGGKQNVKDMAYQYLAYNPNTGGLFDVDTIKKRLEQFKNKGLDKTIFSPEELNKINETIKFVEYLENPLKPVAGMPKRGGSPTAALSFLINAATHGISNIAGGILGEGSAKSFMRTKPGDLGLFPFKNVPYTTDTGAGFAAGVSSSREKSKEEADRIKRSLKYGGVK